MSPKKHSVRWSWGAFFFTFGWLIRRRLYWYGLAYAFLLPLLFVVFSLVYHVHHTRSVIYIYVALVFVTQYIIAPLYCGKLHVRHSVKKQNKRRDLHYASAT
jgi:Protein of unknown function (DUF2628)